MYTVLTFRPEYQYPLYIVVRVRVLRSCARHAARFSSTGFRFKKVVFETLQPVPASPGRRSQTKKNLTAFRDIIKEVGIGPKIIFIAANPRLIGRILDREYGYFQKFVSLEVVPYTDGIALSSILQLARDIQQSKYFTAISYEGKGRF